MRLTGQCEQTQMSGFVSQVRCSNSTYLDAPAACQQGVSCMMHSSQLQMLTHCVGFIDQMLQIPAFHMQRPGRAVSSHRHKESQGTSFFYSVSTLVLTGCVTLHLIHKIILNNMREELSLLTLETVGLDAWL